MLEREFVLRLIQFQVTCFSWEELVKQVSDTKDNEIGQKIEMFPLHDNFWLVRINLIKCGHHLDKVPAGEHFSHFDYVFDLVYIHEKVL